jgi:hypothetical protein
MTAGKIINNRTLGAVIPGQDAASPSSCSRIACSSMIWRSISATFSRVRFLTSAVAFRIVEQIYQFAALFQVKPTCLA